MSEHAPNDPLAFPSRMFRFGRGDAIATLLPPLALLGLAAVLDRQGILLRAFFAGCAWVVPCVMRLLSRRKNGSAASAPLATIGAASLAAGTAWGGSASLITRNLIGDTAIIGTGQLAAAPIPPETLLLLLLFIVLLILQAASCLRAPPAAALIPFSSGLIAAIVTRASLPTPMFADLAICIVLIPAYLCGVALQHYIAQTDLAEANLVTSGLGIGPPAAWQTDQRDRLVGPSDEIIAALPGLTNIRSSQRIPFARALSHLPEIEDEALQNRLDARTPFHDHLQRVTDPDGTERWLIISGTPRRHDGQFSGYLGKMRDVTGIVRSYRQTARRSALDPLTGLAGREAFFDTLASLCIDSQRRVMMLFSFSGFREINTELSHRIGDWLIEVVAERLERAVDPRAVIGRISGNCFAVVQPPGTDGPEALVERFQALLRAPCLVEGMRLVVRVATGVALFPDQATDAATLFHRADLALAIASRDSAIAAVFFQETMERDYVGEVRLGGELATAIENDEIDLVLQPIVDAGSGAFFAAEVLLRWPRPGLSPLNPTQVVALAEASGLIEALGDYILREACYTAVDLGPDIRISVNLSPRQLMSGRFDITLKAILRETGMKPRNLLLEVTENIFLDADTTVRAQLHAIRNLGCQILLDDFGTGFSSLTYLRDFEVDGIKLDAAFIQDLPSLRAQAIMRTVRSLAAGLQMTLIVEGVETESQKDWLLQNGIALQQGYLFARPAEVGGFGAVLTKLEQEIVPPRLL